MECFSRNGAEYSYTASENDNHPTVKLFTDKCSYSKSRTPSIPLNSVFAHRVTVSNRVAVYKLAPHEAESLYGRRFYTTEFFSRDIVSVLNNKLCLGTFVAVPRGSYGFHLWPGSVAFLTDPRDLRAVLNVWNSKDVFRLEVRGVSRVKPTFAKTGRMVDKLLSFFRLPSLPEMFKLFGLHFCTG